MPKKEQSPRFATVSKARLLAALTLLIGSSLSVQMAAAQLAPSPIATIEGPEISQGRFGQAVAISADGTRIAVGSWGPGTDQVVVDNVITPSESIGAVRTFDLVNGSWVQSGQELLGPQDGGSFGIAIALSANGQRLAVGAPGTDAAGEGSGSVRIYDFVGGSWVPVGQILNGSNALDSFGLEIALSAAGDRIAVGAPFSSPNGIQSGSVRVFDLENGSWVQAGDALNGQGASDQFGRVIGLSADGSRIVIAAVTELVKSDGTISAFDFDGDDWTQIGSTLENGSDSFNLGQSLSLSADGTRFATIETVPALRPEDGVESIVHVFETDGSSWSTLGAGIRTESSNTVTLSANGDRLAMNGLEITGTNEKTRLVSLFDLTSDSWTPLGVSIFSDPSRVEGAGDLFGATLAISGDGNTVVAGAQLSYNQQTGAGRVDIIDVNAWTSQPVCGGQVVTVDLSTGAVPTAGDDVIRGTAGNDQIDALGGDDIICALGGDDVVNAGDGFDQVFAGAGNDRLTGGSGNDRLIGGPGADVIFGGVGNDRIQGGDGNDALRGDGGNDIIRGGNGNDALWGGASNDKMWGNLGRDRLFGEDGTDVLRGGAWRDEMDGGAGTNDGCTLTDPGGLTETRTNCEGGVFGR